MPTLRDVKGRCRDNKARTDMTGDVARNNTKVLSGRRASPSLKVTEAHNNTRRSISTRLWSQETQERRTFQGELTKPQAEVSSTIRRSLEKTETGSTTIDDTTRAEVDDV